MPAAKVLAAGSRKKEHVMKTMRTVVCGIFAAVLALAFAACPGPTESIPTTGSITGRLVFPEGTDDITISVELETVGGQPVDRADLSGSAPADGSFRFDGLDPGAYVLYVSLAGSGLRAQLRTVAVTAGGVYALGSMSINLGCDCTPGTGGCDCTPAAGCDCTPVAGCDCTPGTGWDCTPAAGCDCTPGTGGCDCTPAAGCDCTPVTGCDCAPGAGCNCDLGGIGCNCTPGAGCNCDLGGIGCNCVPGVGCDCTPGAGCNCDLGGIGCNCVPGVGCDCTPGAGCNCDLGGIGCDCTPGAGCNCDLGGIGCNCDLGGVGCDCTPGAGCNCDLGGVGCDCVPGAGCNCDLGGIGCNCDLGGVGCDCTPVTGCDCTPGAGCNCDLGGIGCNCDLGGVGCNCDLGGIGCNCDLGGVGCNCDLGGVGCDCTPVTGCYCTPGVSCDCDLGGIGCNCDLGGVGCDCTVPVAYITIVGSNGAPIDGIITLTAGRLYSLSARGPGGVPIENLLWDSDSPNVVAILRTGRSAVATGASVQIVAATASAAWNRTATITATSLDGGSTLVEAYVEVRVIPPPAALSFNISFTDLVDRADGILDIGELSLLALSRTPALISLENPGGQAFGNIRWLLDGADIGDGTETLVLGASANGRVLGIGEHIITVVLEIDGRPYSSRVTFRVTR